MKPKATKIVKQIRKAVRDHYNFLNKEDGWTFKTVPVLGFHSFIDSLNREPTLSFDIHEGGQGDSHYRWIDRADVLLPVLKKITGAKYITVGCCGDNSQEGGIHVACIGVKGTKGKGKKK